MELIGLAIGGTVMIALAASRYCRVWIAILIGTGLIGTMSALAPGTLLATAVRAAVSRDSLELLAMATAAVYLGKLLSELGILGRLRRTLDRTVGNPVVPIAAIPALIGCLPVAGGAIMSAPVVEDLTREQGIAAPRGAAINQVFRHCMQFFLPFSPALALAARLIDMSVFTLIAMLAPIGLITIALGIVLYLRTHSHVEPGHRFTVPDLAELARLSSPIWVALVLAVLFRPPLFIPLLVGIGIAIGLAGFRPGLGSLLRRSLDSEILLTIPAAVSLRAVLIESGTITAAADALSASGIPLALVCVIIPALVAGLTGNLLTHIVITFPLLVSMAPPEVRPAYAFLSYCSGFIAYFASPLHLCQIVTLSYFKCSPADLYRQYRVLIPSLLIAVGLAFLGLLIIKPAIY